MKPFLLLATRADNVVADAEYQASLRFGRLSATELIRVRIDELDLLIEQASTADVVWPARILANFTARYAGREHAGHRW